MPKVIFLCGPHCCGKTSVLKALLEKGDITARGSEIGKDLFYERSFNTESQNPDFEIEVTNLELDRDRSFMDKDGVFGVETWHPGNIAYASVRNPAVVPRLIDLARKSPYIESAVGIWLHIPKTEIVARTQTFKNDREWAGEFYEKVDFYLEKSLEELGLKNRTICINANRTLEEVIQEVSQFLLK